MLFPPASLFSETTLVFCDRLALERGVANMTVIPVRSGDIFANKALCFLFDEDCLCFLSGLSFERRKIALLPAPEGDLVGLLLGVEKIPASPSRAGETDCLNFSVLLRVDLREVERGVFFRLLVGGFVFPVFV